MSEANKVQVGGAHYGGGSYQHWDYVVQGLENRYLEGQVLKYLCRYTEKGGKLDIEKAYHYAVKLKEEIEAGTINPPYPKLSTAHHLLQLSAKYKLQGAAHDIAEQITTWQRVQEVYAAAQALYEMLENYVAPPVMRPTQDEWLMGIAIAAAKGATCPRRSVGCVLTDYYGNILAVACNGVANDREPCDRQGWTCGGADAPSGTGLELCEAVHAEQRALIQAGDLALRCYTTTSPCMHCAKMLMEAGVTKIYFAEEYVHPQVKEYWLRSNDGELMLGFNEHEWIYLPMKK